MGLEIAHRLEIEVEQNRNQEFFLNQLFQENLCIQDLPIKHQESRILVKCQDLAQPLVGNCDKNDVKEEYVDEEAPVLLLLELDQDGGDVVEDRTLLPTNHILIDH